MWRISSLLTDMCCYRSQRIHYCEVIRASINDIYRNGKKVSFAYIGPNTRIVYRSESSRMVWFIQMSAEMWQFEESGQVIFHKMINSLLPDVFKRWHDNKSHHVVTIVLFTSVDVSGTKRQLGHGEIATKTRDYFRVVVDQVHIKEWGRIMEKLRYEFFHFDKEVLLQEDGKIQGRILPAVKGNLLQAIRIASSLASSKFIDRDLRRTGVQTLIITPGAGIFDVDYDLMYQTSLKLLSIEIGVDLVCLSRAPLHVTPLFRYKKEEGEIKHCVPSWLDISFWSSTDRFTNQWIPRCKIYEIQMMGVMEDQVSSISIDYLPKGIFTPRSVDDLMTEYDNAIFKSKEALEAQKIVDDAVASASAAPEFMPKVKNAEENESSMEVTKITAHPVFSSTGMPIQPETTENESDTSSVASIGRKSALTSLLAFGVSHSQTASPNVGQPKPERSLWGFARKPSTASLASQFSTNTNATKTAASEMLSNLFARETAGPPAEEVLEPAVPVPSKPIERHPALPIHNFVKPPLNTSMSQSPGRAIIKRPSLFRKQTDPSKLVKRKDSPLTGSMKEPNQPAERHSMWMTISNPSNVPADKIINISNYGKWQFVYPKKVKRRTVKWRTLKSPAALPLLTSSFPSKSQFKENYRFQIYDVTLYPGQSEYETAEDLLKEMVALRLSMGFQIIAKDKVRHIEAESKPFGNPKAVIEIFTQDISSCRIYMSMGTQIHRIAWEMYEAINIQMYTNTDLPFLDFDRKYHPFVKTQYEEKFKPTTIDFFKNNLQIFNWNKIDQILTGYDDSVLGDQKLFRIRLVLIPVDISTSLISKPIDGAPDRLTNEEIRLEGLKKLLLLLHRGKYYTREERKVMAAKMVKAKVPAIKFYTGSLGNFLLQLSETYMNNSGNEVDAHLNDSLFMQTSARFNRNILLAQLAKEMQTEKGVRLVDRRWHWKTHYHCFMGSEFVTWLLINFSDIDSHEEAVEYGNHLMQQNLFHHVENRHTFLNGHYFYQLQPEYILPVPEKSSKKGLSSLDSKFGSTTSLTDLVAHLPKKSEQSTSPLHMAQDTKAASSTAASDSSTDKGKFVRPKILLSRSLQYNVDLAGRSKRPENLTFHIDRVHNPKNCFQLRLEWLNTTPKLIDDCVINIGRQTEQYGLKLVQVPIQEISMLPNSNPFVSLFRTRFVVDPVKYLASLGDLEKGLEMPVPSASPDTPDPLKVDPLYYHKYMLRAIGYFLDVDPLSESVTKKLDVQYSWGKPFYRASQFIHKSGYSLVQVLEDGEFVFMPNHLAASRVFDLYTTVPPKTAMQQQTLTPPLAAVSAGAEKVSSDDLLKELKDLCASHEKLKLLFTKAKTAWASRGLNQSNSGSGIQSPSNGEKK